MPAGLLIYNEDNFLQIDSKYQNLFFAGKDTVTCSTTEGTLKRGDVTVVGKCPVLAFRPNVNTQVRLVSKSGDDWTYRVYIHPNTTSPTLEFWVFDLLPPSAPSSGAGLLIYSETGDLVFNSAEKPMKIVEAWSGSFSGTTTLSYAHPIVVLSIGTADVFAQISSYPVQSGWLINMFKCPTSDSVEFVMQGIGTVPVPGGSVGSRSYFVVDATHLP